MRVFRRRLPEAGKMKIFTKDWFELSEEEKKEVKRRAGFSEDSCVILI